MLLEEECLPLHLIEQLPEDPSAAAWREEGWKMPAIGGTQQESCPQLPDASPPAQMGHGEKDECIAMGAPS